MNDDRVREGIEHLQGAALEVIAAVRAFLDVAEDLVKDPAELVAIAGSVRTQAAQAAHLAQAAAGHADTSGETASKVERIPVV
jgi:hypothetical protein